MSQIAEFDVSREVERRLRAQAGALENLVSLAGMMRELASAPELDAKRLTELVREDERFFGRLRKLEEGLAPYMKTFRERWMAENPAPERRQAIDEAAGRVAALIEELAQAQSGLRKRLEELKSARTGKLAKLPRRGARGRR
jgi:hypothetical protein